MAWGPVEGWIARCRSGVYAVKGCSHPLPRLIASRKVGEPRLEPCRCTSGRSVELVNPSECELVDPVEAAEALMRRSGVSGVWAAARLLLEHLHSAGLEAGLTGGLLYREKPRDIDVVIYGGGWEAYRVLAELRAEGVTSPLTGGKLVEEATRSSWPEWLTRLAPARLLYGVVAGYPYSARIVPCTSPQRCRPSVQAATISATATILGSPEPWATPTLYRMRVGGARVLAYNSRIRYAELSAGLRVRLRSCPLDSVEEGVPLLILDLCSGVDVLGVVDEPSELG